MEAEGMGIEEKRKYQRHTMNLALSCNCVGSPSQQVHSGKTVNVGPGGILFETSANGFEPGNLLKIELSIPPTTGLLELGGRISSLAKVLRIQEIAPRKKAGNPQYGIAVEFCQAPQVSE
jgi:hypothetical protein